MIYTAQARTLCHPSEFYSGNFRFVWLNPSNLGDFVIFASICFCDVVLANIGYSTSAGNPVLTFAAAAIFLAYLMGCARNISPVVVTAAHLSGNVLAWEESNPWGRPIHSADRGLEFKHASIRTRSVISCSSVGTCWPITLRKWCFIDLTAASQMPPWWGAAGWMNSQFFPRVASPTLISLLSHVVPLSLRISFSASRWTTSRSNAEFHVDRVCRQTYECRNVPLCGYFTASPPRPLTSI